MLLRYLKGKYIIFLITLLTNCLLYSQEETETNKLYLKKIYKYTDTNNDSILYYAKKLKNSKNKCTFFRAINFEAKAFYQKGHLDIAKEKSIYVLNSIKNTEIDCYKLNKFTALNRLFWVYKNQNHYQKAFEAALERKKIIESISVKDYRYHVNLLSVYHNLATIKNIMGFYGEAREILKSTLPKLPKIYHNLNENNYYTNPKQSDYFLKLNQSSILNLIAETYLNSSIESSGKDLDSASLYFKKAFKVAKTFDPPHKNTETLYKLREAEVLAAKNKFLEAINLIKKFEVNSKQFKTEQNINSLKAICYNGLKKTDSAIFYSGKFLACQKKNPISKKRLAVVYDILANQYYKTKQIDSAFKYSELTVLEIKALNKSKNEVNKSHYLHDFKNAKELNEKIINNNRSNKITLITYGILLLLIILIIIFFFYRKYNIEVDEINNKSNDDITTIKKKKKKYNIDEALEKEILNGINQLEKSKDFLHTDFGISMLAQKLNTNTSYLSYTINKIKNKTFKQYITELKIEYLIKKLKEDKNYRKYTIKYLAEEIGYTNASAFTRAFKNYIKVTPSEFIKSLDKI